MHHCDVTEDAEAGEEEDAAIEVVVEAEANETTHYLPQGPVSGNVKLDQHR